MARKKYVLVCTQNPQHHKMVERDPWTWVPSQDIVSLMPRDALAVLPTPRQLRACRCHECGAGVVAKEIEAQNG